MDKIKFQYKELEYLINQFSNWCVERNLHTNSTICSQIMKFDEEIGELSRSVQKKDILGQMDGIGDTVVVLTVMYNILLHLCNKDYTENIDEFKELCTGRLQNQPIHFDNSEFIETSYCDMRKTINQYIRQCLEKDLPSAYVWFDIALLNIMSFAQHLNLNIVHCLRMAYATISFRTGKIVNGVFVKDIPAFVIYVPKQYAEQMEITQLLSAITNYSDKYLNGNKFKIEFTDKPNMTFEMI